jgi:hypothetical protein
VPDRAVTTAADGDLEVALAAEADGGDDVVDVRGSNDEGRPTIEHGVPDPPGIVVAGGIGRDDLAREGAAKLVELGVGWHGGTRDSHAESLVRRAALRRRTPYHARGLRLDTHPVRNAWFFSLDAEKHWPNYATIVTNDEHDQASDLDRPGVFRLNLGVDKATFKRYAADPEPDFTAFDTVLPHPVYAAQRWISILDPSWSTWNETVIPLIAVAHDRLAAQRARHRHG